MMLAFGEEALKPKIMKKIIVLLVLFFATNTLSHHAEAQPPHAKAWSKKGKKAWKRGGYYYYPSANVYYSPVSGRYWYPRNGRWVNTSVLPPSVVIYQQPGYIVYRDIDDDIWRDNRVHYSRYQRPQRYRPAVVGRPAVSVNIQARF